jgi:ketosteroid isomerase-like protein
LPKAELSDKAALRRRALTFYRKWSLLDMEKLAPFYSQSPGLVVFNDVEPVKFDGWREFAEAERKIMEKMSWWKTNPKDLRVTIWGDVALTTATPVLEGEFKSGRKAVLTLRHTAVWRRKGGRWLIIHDHWSIPLPSS